MSHVECQNSEAFDTFSIIWAISKFYKIPTFSSLGKTIYELKIIPWCVTQSSSGKIILIIRAFLLSRFKIHTNIVERYVP